MNALLASTLRDVTKCTRSRLLVANYCHGSVPAKIAFCQLQTAIKIGELKEFNFVLAEILKFMLTFDIAKKKVLGLRTL